MEVVIIFLIAASPVVLPFIFLEMMDKKQHPINDKRRKLARIIGWSLVVLLLFIIITGDGTHRGRDFMKVFIFAVDFLK